MINLAVMVLLAALAIVPATRAQEGDPAVVALVEALRQSAPNTGRADDELYTDWQIMAPTLKRWSRRCMGGEVDPKYLEANPVDARALVSCVMGPVLREQRQASSDEIQAVRRAAAWWMTGDAEAYTHGWVSDYTARVAEAYRRLSSGGGAR